MIKNKNNNEIDNTNSNNLSVYTNLYPYVYQCSLYVFFFPITMCLNFS